MLENKLEANYHEEVLPRSKESGDKKLLRTSNPGGKPPKIKTPNSGGEPSKSKFGGRYSPSKYMLRGQEGLVSFGSSLLDTMVPRTKLIIQLASERRRLVSSDSFFLRHNGIKDTRTKPMITQLLNLTVLPLAQEGPTSTGLFLLEHNGTKDTRTIIQLLNLAVGKCWRETRNSPMIKTTHNAFCEDNL